MTEQLFDWSQWLDAPSADGDDVPWFFGLLSDETIWCSALWATAVALAEVLEFCGHGLPAHGLQAMAISAIGAWAHEATPDASASDDAQIAVKAALATYAQLLEAS